MVPNVAPELQPLRKNPVFLYYQDNFQRPNPFRPDVAVMLDSVVDKKIDALDSHVSQFYEWLPWVAGNLADVPKDAAARKAWLKKARTREPGPAVRASLIKWYGAEKGNAAKYYEAFEVCEYGAQPTAARLRELFPMLKSYGQLCNGSDRMNDGSKWATPATDRAPMERQSMVAEDFVYFC